MASQELFITHQFAGGWATAFGSDSSVSPDQNGVIQLPFLADAEDVLYELDGGPHCAPGALKLNSSVLESGAAINGIFDYWKTGTTGTSTQHRVVHVSTKIKADNADGTFADILTGLTAGGTPTYAVFEDLLVMADDAGNVPKSWDGTTAQNLAGSPPAFQFVEEHKNYLFAAGVPANPSRLYYCVPLTPNDWASAGSGSIDISPNDGDRITGIASHKNDLFVFKGPYKGSIHRITGSAPTGSDAFARSTFVTGIGSANHRGIFRFGDDLGFVWSDGTVRSLSATASFGDFSQGSLSKEIDNWLRDHLVFTQLKRVQAVNWPDYGIVLFAVPINGSSTNNNILMMDYRLGTPRWAQWPSFGTKGVSIGIVVDSASLNQRIVMGGGSDGYVRKFGQSARSIDGSTNLSPKVTTPFLTYGLPLKMKTLSAVAVAISPHNNLSFTFGWTEDDRAQQTTSIAQGGSDVLGTASSSQFTLGSSALGGSRFVHRFSQMEEGGEFRAIQYQITNAAGGDLELHHIGAQISLGADSTEA